MNCFFAASRCFVKYFGLSFSRSTRFGQYSGRIMSIVCTTRGGRGCTGESSVRTDGAGDLRSATGGG